jgi:hypothetical protein
MNLASLALRRGPHKFFSAGQGDGEGLYFSPPRSSFHFSPLERSHQAIAAKKPDVKVNWRKLSDYLGAFAQAFAVMGFMTEYGLLPGQYGKNAQDFPNPPAPISPPGKILIVKTPAPSVDNVLREAIARMPMRGSRLAGLKSVFGGPSMR